MAKCCICAFPEVTWSDPRGNWYCGARCAYQGALLWCQGAAVGGVLDGFQLAVGPPAHAPMPPGDVALRLAATMIEGQLRESGYSGPSFPQGAPVDKLPRE